MYRTGHPSGSTFKPCGGFRTVHFFDTQGRRCSCLVSNDVFLLEQYESTVGNDGSVANIDAGESAANVDGAAVAGFGANNNIAAAARNGAGNNGNNDGQNNDGAASGGHNPVASRLRARSSDTIISFNKRGEKER